MISTKRTLDFGLNFFFSWVLKDAAEFQKNGIVKQSQIKAWTRCEQSLASAFAFDSLIISCLLITILDLTNTVKPLLSGQLLKSRNYCQYNTVNKTPFKRLPLLNDRGLLSAVPTSVLLLFSPLFSGQ